MPKILPAAIDGMPYPKSSFVAVQKRRGGPFLATIKRPVSVQMPRPG